MNPTDKYTVRVTLPPIDDRGELSLIIPVTARMLHDHPAIRDAVIEMAERQGYPSTAVPELDKTNTVVTSGWPELASL